MPGLPALQCKFYFGLTLYLNAYCESNSHVVEYIEFYKSNWFVTFHSCHNYYDDLGWFFFKQSKADREWFKSHAWENVPLHTWAFWHRSSSQPVSDDWWKSFRSQTSKTRIVFLLSDCHWARGQCCSISRHLVQLA